jgi:mannose-6-phosphate isomerase-like protein (cupin superfamily)
MDNIQKIKLVLNESKTNSFPYVFKNICPNVPQWDQFIKHIDFEYHNPKAAFIPNNPYRERFIKGVLFKNPMYLNVHNPTTNFYPEINLFFDIFNKAIPYSGTPLAAYINFSKEEASNPHFDKKDHLYWQCIGSTQWKFYKDDKLIENVEVNPGDVVYIPAGVVHDVLTNGPRAALQFKYNTPSKDFSFD